MFFFYVSWCTETLCDEVVQMLMHGRPFGQKDDFTVTASAGIRNRDVRVAAIVVRELEKTKPDK
jgi:hypothetical protein